MSWDEVTNILNQELRPQQKPYDTSTYTKKYYDWKQGYEQIFSRMQGDEYYQELKSQTRILEKEKKKLQTEKVEYNRWLREEARNELLLERFCDAVEKLNEDEPLIVPDQAAWSWDADNRSWVLAFGDAHFGTEFKVEGLHGEIINRYDPDVFYERMDELFHLVVGVVRKENIKQLSIYDLGDCIDGILRVSQLMKLKYGVVESTIKYSEWLANWLNDLSKECGCLIRFQMTKGNHSELRMLGQPKGSFPDDNMEMIILEFVKLRLKDNPNIEIIENTTGMIFEELQGYSVLGYHGESKNMEQTLKDFQKLYRTRIDILISGHLHHSYSENVGIDSDVMRVPSIMGVDDFSLGLHKASNPGATLFAVEKGKGKILEYNIKMKSGGVHDLCFIQN